MSGLFASRGSIGEPWFRLGRLEVGTTMAVVLAVAASWLLWVISPGLPAALAYSPDLLLAGEVWRLVTWPLANPLGLWGVINLFFFWYFGTELEQAVGRVRMASLLVGIWGSLTIAATVVGLLLGGTTLMGIGWIQFAVLLVWIAEYPDRRFLFNIPAWVFGLVLVGIQVLQALAFRDLGGLLSLALACALIAIVARRAGLFASYGWIPGARPAGRAPRARRPTAARPARPSRADARYTSDREKLDALLDQINEKGLNSLSDAQRKELLRLRERLRRP
ncbi:MAG: rhomboid family intramembrane serine protease [Propionicimonas sp.]|nr:rhomboid family intramembrane serine protease [Propionicimonas sp.]